MSEKCGTKLDRVLTSIARYSKDVFGDELEAVILYGSYARGDYDAGSDIDVMVLVKMDRDALRQYEDGFDELASNLSLEDEDCTTISLIIDSWPHVCEWLPVVPFYRNVMREGVRVSA